MKMTMVNSGSQGLNEVLILWVVQSTWIDFPEPEDVGGGGERGLMLNGFSMCHTERTSQILTPNRGSSWLSSHINMLNPVGGGPRVVVSTAAFHARVRGSVPGLGGLKETKMFLPHPRVKVSIVGSLRDREVACSASDRQGSNFESCVWRTVSSQSSHQPQEVLLAQFSLYVHKGGLKPDSFHFICLTRFLCRPVCIAIQSCKHRCWIGTASMLGQRHRPLHEIVCYIWPEVVVFIHHFCW